MRKDSVCSRTQNRSTNLPLVSVIMNCFNCEKYLREAIDSVYAQTYKNWEIIFWDNASTDGSAMIARGYDEHLRYFRGEETIPVGAARNKALEQGKGEFIAFLDCDDIWMPEKLEKQIPLFDDPDVGLVFSDAVYFNQEGKTKLLYRHRRYSTGRCFLDLATDYFLALLTVVIRRIVLDEEEWFDEDFNYVEEADLFIRIAHGSKLAMINEPLARYRMHVESLSWTGGHRVFDEYAIMLEKHKRMFHELSSANSSAIPKIEKYIAMNRAMCFLREGKKSRAREHLLPFAFKDMKGFMLFVATFLPNKALIYLTRRPRQISL